MLQHDSKVGKKTIVFQLSTRSHALELVGVHCMRAAFAVPMLAVAYVAGSLLPPVSLFLSKLKVQSAAELKDWQRVMLKPKAT